MRKLTKFLSLLVMMAIVVSSLAGCSGGGGGENGGENDTPDFVYVAEYSGISVENLDNINNAYWHDGKIYCSANMKTGTQTETDPETGESWEYDVYEDVLASMNEDGSGFAVLENYTPLAVPEGREGSSYLNSMSVDSQGNIWLVEDLYTYYFDLPEGFDETSDDRYNYYVSTDEYYLRKLDSTGNELMSINTSQFKENETDYLYVNSISVDNEGNVYLATGSMGILVLDPQGQELKRISIDESNSSMYINNLMTLPDGRVAAYVSSYDESTQTNTSEFLPIDLTTGDFGEAIPAPSNGYNSMPGGGDYDIYYQSGSSFFGYNFDTQESTRLFTWINVDVDDSNIRSVMPTSDGRIICISTEYGDNGTENELVTLTKTDASQVQEKEIITFACMYMDYNIRGEILDFNRSSDKYRIEVQDYSEYNTDSDYSAGLTKLTTEILGGDVPDIFSVDQMPIDQFAAKGLLEDLWPYIEADTEIGGREGVMEQVFNAASLEGKLYQIGSEFMIQTLAGMPQVVGQQQGWTLDDLMAAYQTMPEGADIFSQGTIRESVMRQCCSMLFDNLVNWETGECNFDSDEFRNILEFANMFPETYDWENQGELDGGYTSEAQRMREGMQMLTQVYMSTFTDLQYYNAMCGGNASYVGYPTGSGNGAAFTMSGGLAMSSTCSNKDGAWEFLRTFLTEDYQQSNTWSFPTNKTVFDSRLKNAMTPIYYTDPETGEEVEQSQGGMSWGPNPEDSIEFYAMSQEEADQLMSLIDSTTVLYSYDEELLGIVMDAAAPYFAGQRTLDDVARQVQSRVSLYVNEQR